MKYVLCLVGIYVVLLSGAEAKYVFPKDQPVRSRSEEIASYQMKEYDEDGDGVDRKSVV